MKYTAVLVMVACMALAGSSYSTVRAQQAAARSVLEGVYTLEQSKRGETRFASDCAACHDAKLTGDIGPALVGKDFIGGWKSMTVGDLFEKIKTDMPANAPGTLTAAQTADVLAFVLSANRYPAGTTELPPDAALLKNVRMAEPPAQ